MFRLSLHKADFHYRSIEELTTFVEYGCFVRSEVVYEILSLFCMRQDVSWYQHLIHIGMEDKTTTANSYN